MAVIKGVCSDLRLAETLIHSGVTTLADSNINHLKKYDDLDMPVRRMLIRSPALSEIDLVVAYSDVSLNSEIKVIRALSDAALKQKKIHQVIVMIELGDLREGILEADLFPMVEAILPLKGIKLIGIGANFSCLSHARPPEDAFETLSSLANALEDRYGLSLSVVSGGNSSSLHFVMKTTDLGRINQLRIGDSLLTGRDSITNAPLKGLKTDVFRFVGEVIEFNDKMNQKTNQVQSQALLNFGYQDTVIAGLTSETDLDVLHFSSNHTVIHPNSTHCELGSEISFSMSYYAILQAFSSPNVTKFYTPLRRSHEDRNTMAQKQKHRVSKKDHRERPQR